MRRPSSPTCTSARLAAPTWPRPRVRERLVEAVAGRRPRGPPRRPAGAARATGGRRCSSWPRRFFDALAPRSTAGRPVIARARQPRPRLVAPGSSRPRLEGRTGPCGGGPVHAESGDAADASPPGCPDAEVALAYPGVLAARRRVRDPRPLPRHAPDRAPRGIVDRLCDGARQRPRNATARRRPTYEAALAPIYAFSPAWRRAPPPRALTRGGALSRTVWRAAQRAAAARSPAAGPRGHPGRGGGLNRIGLGPFEAASAARTCAAPACSRWARGGALGARRAEHVIFGHTHRPGPLPGDDPADGASRGTRLWNTGCWLP